MGMIKKIIGIASIATLLSAGVHADEDYYYNDMGGFGYEDCCRASCIAPAVALGTIALVAIIAVAVQNSSSGGDSHAHCD